MTKPDLREQYGTHRMIHDICLRKRENTKGQEICQMVH